MDDKNPGNVEKNMKKGLHSGRDSAKIALDYIIGGISPVEKKLSEFYSRARAMEKTADSDGNFNDCLL